MQTLSQVFCAFVLILQLFNDQIFFDLMSADTGCIHHPHYALVASVLPALILELLHPELAYIDRFGVGYKVLDPPELVISILFILADLLILGALLVLEGGIERDEVICIGRQLFLVLILEIDFPDSPLNKALFDAPPLVEFPQLVGRLVVEHLDIFTLEGWQFSLLPHIHVG